MKYLLHIIPSLTLDLSQVILAYLLWTTLVLAFPFMTIFSNFGSYMGHKIIPFSWPLFFIRWETLTEWSEEWRISISPATAVNSVCLKLVVLCKEDADSGGMPAVQGQVGYYININTDGRSRQKAWSWMSKKIYLSIILITTFTHCKENMVSLGL